MSDGSQGKVGVPMELFPGSVHLPGLEWGG